MKLFVSLILSVHFALAANILTYKLYDRANSGRMDILLTFDTPYNGRITQKKDADITTLLLYDTSYESKVSKTLNSEFITNFAMEPQDNRTALFLTLPKNITFKVSKTIDNYGLRLRFEHNKAIAETLPQTTLEKIKTINTSKEIQSNTLKEPLMNKRYALVMGILIAAVLLLYIIKRRVEKGKKPGSWLFKNNPHNLEDFTILFQKPLDSQNKVVMMEFGSRQYLVIIGSTNLLLDTFNDKESLTADGFEGMLRENQHELDKYMQLQESERSKNPLQSYKEKASLEVYRSQM